MRPRSTDEQFVMRDLERNVRRKSREKVDVRSVEKASAKGTEEKENMHAEEVVSSDKEQ